MEARQQNTIRFEGFELDLQRNELRRAGQTIPVEPQVLDLLAFLAQRPDQLLTRDDLIDGVWKGRIVSDSAIATRISAARQAVGDTGKDQAIINEIERVYQAGRPILVGTTSVEHSELIHRLLQQKKIQHNVLNAKIHQSEAVIVNVGSILGSLTTHHLERTALVTKIEFGDTRLRLEQLDTSITVHLDLVNILVGDDQGLVGTPLRDQIHEGREKWKGRTRHSTELELLYELMAAER